MVAEIFIAELHLNTNIHMQETDSPDHFRFANRSICHCQCASAGEVRPGRVCRRKRCGVRPVATILLVNSDHPPNNSVEGLALLGNTAVDAFT
jgi:hypothetical protein